MPAASKVRHRAILAEYLCNQGADPEDTEYLARLQPIANLRFGSEASPISASIHGVVVLTKPILIVRDSTGGMMVEPKEAPPLKIGDEVEVAGIVGPTQFRATMREANVRLLWEGNPAPPLSLTANQAATGTFDARFIQLDGSLKSKTSRSDGSIVLNLESGPQAFQAILSPGRSAVHIRDLRLESVLRLRGVCVVASKYTNGLTPFVLLVRSSEEVEEIAPPPWWSLSTLISLGIGLLLLSGAAYHMYVQAKHWRLRAVVEERRRLAHEIHDTLAQSFAGIGFQLQAIRNSMPPNSPALEQQVELACGAAQP